MTKALVYIYKKKTGKQHAHIHVCKIGFCIIKSIFRFAIKTVTKRGRWSKEDTKKELERLKLYERRYQQRKWLDI